MLVITLFHNNSPGTPRPSLKNFTGKYLPRQTKTFNKMTLIESIIERAKSNRQRIVLPESLEERTIKAADKSIADGLAEIILIGNRAEILKKADEFGLKNISKATIIDPETSDKTAEYTNLLYELRKNKGMTPEQAAVLVKDPLYFGCLIIKNGDADGQISGALSTTGETLRPALQIIKCAPGKP